MKDWFEYNHSMLFGSPMTHVSLGAHVFGNDLYNASNTLREFFRQGVRNWFRNASHNMGYQLHLDFRHQESDKLKKYGDVTEKSGAEDASTAYRDQILIDYTEQNKNRKLKSLIARFYVCKKIDSDVPVTFSHKERVEYEKVVWEEAERELVNVINSFNNSMGRSGAYMERMDREAIISHSNEFYNPSFTSRKNFNPVAKYNPQQSALSQIVRGGFNTGKHQNPAYGFHFDGHFHNLIILSKPPQHLEAGMIKTLSNLRIDDFRIVETFYPQNKDKIKAKHQKEKNRTDRDTDVESQTASALKSRIITDIANGYKILNWLMVFHVWDKTPVGLSAKTQAIKDAIHEWDSAEYYVASMPATSRKIFDQIQPGFPFGKYQDHVIPMNDDMSARVVNLDASFHGDTRDGNILYKNHNEGLVSVALFKNDTPLPFTLIGMTGAGKSAFLYDLLMQAMAYIRYLVIVEEGLAHEKLSRNFKSKPIIVHPNSNYCFGQFDTVGLPYSPAFLNSLSTLLTRMFDRFDSHQEKELTKSYLEFYCNRIYTDIFKDRVKHNSDLKFKHAKEALIAYNYWQVLLETDLETEFIDSWNQVREMKTNHPEGYKVLESKVNEEKIVNFLNNYETMGYVRDVFISTLKPEEFPSLSQYVESLESFPEKNHDKKRIEFIATILSSWCKHRGSKGGLFDGIRNLPSTKRISHWELSKLGEDEDVLKQMVGFMISHFERNKIMTMPRHLKKVFLIEEGSRYLSIPGSEKTIKELYAQMRKYSCVAGFTVQQYAQFSESPICPVVLGNSKQLFLLRQNDIQDVIDICNRIPSIPESAREAILRYEMPEQNNYTSSWFTYFQMGAAHPLCGTCKFEKRREIK